VVKKRDQKKTRRRPRPYKRQLHFPDGEVWSYRFTNGVVAIRTPDCETTYKVPMPEISGMSWDDMERGQRKQWWTGVGPQCVKDHIKFHLRPDPHSFPIPTLVFMHPMFFGRWHLYEGCRFLPHRRHHQAYDPARVFADDLDERLGEPATLLNLCGVCMDTFQKKFRCMDCHEPEPEYYMVWNDLWKKAVPDGAGQLCFSCLGKRLGRPLRQSDFPPHIPLNQLGNLPEHIGRLAP
jgi:hypothetical protein